MVGTVSFLQFSAVESAPRRPRPFVPFAAVALRPRIAARRCERSAACFLRRIIACLSPPRTRGRGPAALDRRARGGLQEPAEFVDRGLCDENSTTYDAFVTLE